MGMNPFENIDKGPSDGWVMEAVNKRDIEKVKEAIKKTDDIDFTKLERTPLMISLANNDFDIAELLINSGADIKTKNGINSNVAHIACRHNATRILEFVKDKEPFLFKETNNRLENPLFTAIRHSFLESFSFILESEHCPDVNHINIDGETLLDMVSKDIADEKISETNQIFKEMLLENGALLASQLVDNPEHLKSHVKVDRTENQPTTAQNKENTKKEKTNNISGLSGISKKKRKP